jgi:hypothetical protein
MQLLAFADERALELFNGFENATHAGLGGGIRAA